MRNMWFLIQPAFRSGESKSSWSGHSFTLHLKQEKKSAFRVLLHVLNPFRSSVFPFFQHQRTVHQKLRPFACSECSATFGERGNLYVHIDIGERNIHSLLSQCFLKVTDYEDHFLCFSFVFSVPFRCFHIGTKCAHTLPTNPLRRPSTAGALMIQCVFMMHEIVWIVVSNALQIVSYFSSLCFLGQHRKAVHVKVSHTVIPPHNLGTITNFF